MGCRSRAGPQDLGPKTWGTFKSVMAYIKKLNEVTLTAFVAGGKLEVQGHTLAMEKVNNITLFLIFNGAF